MWLPKGGGSRWQMDVNGQCSKENVSLFHLYTYIQQIVSLNATFSCWIPLSSYKHLYNSVLHLSQRWGKKMHELDSQHFIHLYFNEHGERQKACKWPVLSRRQWSGWTGAGRHWISVGGSEQPTGQLTQIIVRASFKKRSHRLYLGQIVFRHARLRCSVRLSAVCWVVQT